MLTGQTANSNPQTQALLTFTVAGQWCALPVANIVRIIDMVALTPLPGVSAAIVGLINVQGKVVPALDLRLRFGLPRQPYTLQTPMIIINTPHPGRVLALIVDRVGEVVEVPADQLTSTETIIPTQMAALDTTPGTFFTSVATIEQNLILVLNTHHILTGAEQDTIIQALGNHSEIKRPEDNRSES